MVGSQASTLSRISGGRDLEEEPMKLYFDDTPFDGQLQRSVGKADSGMANVGECLAIAEQITPADRGSWYRAWSGFASRLVSRADEAAKGGHRVSARGAYIRAAEYFRQAFFFHRENLNGSELQTAYAASVQAFRSALGYFSHPARILSGAVSGYLFAPSHTDGRCPTILHIGGYDGIAEELYASVPAALERGYVVAALDGPGQGAMLYDRRVPMRPDWENVVPAMFDAVTADPEVDPDRVVLVGRSFGGLIAPRGAAGEHRLAAMIVDPGQYDLGTAFTARLGPLMDRVNDPAADPQFDALLDIPAMKALLEPRMVTHGVTSVRAYCADVLRYTNAATVTRIICPTFVTDNQTDEVSTGQGKILFDHLTCPKEFRLFTKAEGAEGHCEGMAPIVFWDAAFNWLDSLLQPGPAKTLA
jgi:Alpha/beta hydrolase family